ncbi:sensor histidine kinase [Streptacidiphilus rugosus]|uniref:sensor histidine kinase n=1 Tax=Streptacidiphilus rugosus TaxID=405783 RepID=UPI0007C6DFD5|nr:histidine kinase [Streptacidiphilus rugosus]
MTRSRGRLVGQAQSGEARQLALRAGEPEADVGAVLGNLGRGAPSPKVADSLVAALVGGYAVMGITTLIAGGLGWRRILIGGGSFLLIALIQLLHSDRRLDQLRSRLMPWSLLLQAVLTYTPPLAFGIFWGGMAGFLGASGLLLLRPRWGWTLFALVVLAAAVSGPLEGWTVLSDIYLVVSTTLASLTLWGLTRLSLLVIQVQASQGELARVAVVRERLRFARDLHDLLGYSLSAIVLKSELTKRLVDGSPKDALNELDDILLVSRQALTDVRAVSRGYRQMSLAEEAEAAQSVLRAAGIRALVDLGARPPEGELDTILATVLREAVTNLLRHSKAEQCLITTCPEGEGIRLTIANDGVTGASGPGERMGSGNGLQNLTARLSEAGGRLAWEVEGGRWFVLRAVAPLSGEAPGPIPAPRSEAVPLADPIPPGGRKRLS